MIKCGTKYSIKLTKMAETPSITEQLEEILNEVATVKTIKNYRVKADSTVQVGDGFLSQFFKGEVQDLDTGRSLKVAIKKLPKFEHDYTKVFNNEINFYTKVLPELQKLQENAGLKEQFDNTAEYFTSRLDQDKTFIALKDLSPEGYQLHDKREFLSEEQLERIFGVYGQFHALSFALRKQNEQKYLETVEGFEDVFDLFTNTDSTRKNMEKVINSAINNLDETSLEHQTARTLFQAVVPVVEQAFQYSGLYRCITHGDCWSNNFLFKYSSKKLEDFKIIDFQLSRDGSPVHDLSYLFYSGASKSNMDSLEKYLKIYHNHLSTTLELLNEDAEEIFPYQVLVEEWRKNALMGVVLGIYLWQAKLLNKEDFVDALKEGGVANQEDTSKMFEGLIDVVLSGEEFKSRSADILKHAFEFGILSESLNKQ